MRLSSPLQWNLALEIYAHFDSQGEWFRLELIRWEGQGVVTKRRAGRWVNEAVAGDPSVCDVEYWRRKCSELPGGYRYKEASR